MNAEKRRCNSVSQEPISALADEESIKGVMTEVNNALVGIMSKNGRRMGEILPPTTDYIKSRDVVAVRRPLCRSVRAATVLVKCVAISGSESLEKRIHQRWRGLETKPGSGGVADDNLLPVDV